MDIGLGFSVCQIRSERQSALFTSPSALLTATHHPTLLLQYAIMAGVKKNVLSPFEARWEYLGEGLQKRKRQKEFEMYG